ncbi:AAA family ATPase [Rhodococcus sp. (in: high G+C Gram-positive bacteria)]|uniref:bifunctional aminoglycoside phosphotransferase/ATP-binding protein n=1 Tax=Rhodococcus sp. TaxID=1831 RepID=UPI003BAF5240
MPTPGDMNVAGRETHTARVVMVGDVVYKAKKPIRTDFLDFSTVEKRRQACEREVELNRRFSSDVYLGVAELTDPGGGPPEPLVKMKRMPDDRRLATLITRGEEPAEVLDEIARLLARFHAHARRGPDVDEDGTRDAVAARWRANVAEVSDFDCETPSTEEITEIGRRGQQYLAGRKRLFATRIADGRVVDGHADLLADDIFCLPDGPRILDCLDFDDHLRHVDGVDDAACLAMDLEYLGRADLAAAFLRRYCAEAGDDPPRSLIHHYVAYRAFVRAKVSCLRYTQGSPSALPDARNHSRLALDHLRAGTVRLALIGGLPGSGKSTLSRAVAERCDAVLLSSDHVRKELAGVPPDLSQAAEFEQGLYSGPMTGRTYAELLHRARDLLATGRSVIVDASWGYPRLRERAAQVASCAHSDLVEIECTVPRDVAINRIRTRPHGESDATADVYDAMAARGTTWPSATQVDTTADIAESSRAVESRWEATDGWRNYECVTVQQDG